MQPVQSLPFPKPQLLLFDVYETLLDMHYIQRKVNSLLDDKGAYSYWFELLMQHCLLDNSIGAFHPFASIVKATLQMAGDSFNHTISDSDAEEVIQMLDQLPVNEDVASCISTLANHNFKIAALTNASGRMIKDRMESTGLVSYFEKVLSAEDVKKYKPATEVYRWALQQLNASADEVIYVSAHTWDIAGAASAGMKTVYLAHPGQLIYPLAPKPTIVFKTFEKMVHSFTSWYS